MADVKNESDPQRPELCENLGEGVQTEDVKIAPDPQLQVNPASPNPASASSLTREESTARKALIATLVSILLSPLSVVLGFFLGHTLQNPRLTIEDVSQSYHMVNHNLSDGLMKELVAQPLLVTQLRDMLGRNLNNQEQSSCIDWLDGEPWRDTCTRDVLRAARTLKVAAVTDPPLSPILASLRPPPAQLQQFATILDHLIAELEAIDKDTSNARTGDMSFQVGVLNAGDFDGVLSKYGHLRFAGGRISIYAAKYTVIKAHGFEEIEFSVDDGPPNERKALDAWRLHVKSRDETPFELLLRTGAGGEVNTSRHLFK